MHEIHSIDYFLYLVWISNPISVVDLITLDEFRKLIQLSDNTPEGLCYYLRQALYQFEDEELYEWCAVIHEELQKLTKV